MKKRLVLAILIFCMALVLLPVQAGAATDVYVSASGSDSTGDGTNASPYASLAHAVSVAPDGSTITVMSDLTMTACARYYSKSLTIRSGSGGPFTVTRGTPFATLVDPVRNTYNPAMLEAAGTPGAMDCALRLENIIFDDAGLHEGTTFAWQVPGATNNTNYVQDSIVASYDGSARITLGSGVVLRNYGGMSAVHITGGSGLVMEDGSVIEDTITPPARGAQRAIMLDSSTIDMQQGSAIRNIRGGVCIFSYRATMTVDGEITGLVNGGIGGAVYMASGSTVLTVGPTGNIHNNQVAYGTIFSQGLASTVHLYGKVNDNFSGDHAGGIAMGNNAYGAVTYLYPGAEIIGNIATNSGGGVLVSCGSFHMLGGTISGNIAGAGRNAAVDQSRGGGVNVRRGGDFTLEGGTISDNYSYAYGGGLAYDASDYFSHSPFVNLLGGTITGNHMTATLTGTGANTTASGGVSNDLAISSTNYGRIGDTAAFTNRNVLIADGATLGNLAIYFETNTKTLTPSAASFGLKLGNASPTSITGLNNASTSKGWGSAFCSFWVQKTSPVVLDVGGVLFDPSLPVYAVMQQTGADGLPLAGAPYLFFNTSVGGQTITVNVAGSESGYAVALVQPNTDYGSVALDMPAQVLEKPGATSYDIPFTATFTMSQNLANIFDQEQDTLNPSNCNFVFTATLDEALEVKKSGGDYTFTSDIFDVVSVSGGPNELTLHCTLKSDWKDHLAALTDPMTITGTGVLTAADFQAGRILSSTANVQINLAIAPAMSITIPGNNALTTLVGIASYLVTFDPNGGVLASGTISPVSVWEGDAVPRPTDPTRSSYRFAGWTLNGTPYEFLTPVTGDITLLAQWEPNQSETATFTVSYLGNGNTGGQAPVDPNSPYLEGSVVTVLGKGTLVKQNSVFKGWATSPGGPVVYRPGQQFAIVSDVTLYAVWAPAELPVLILPTTGDVGSLAFQILILISLAGVLAVVLWHWKLRAAIS
ncbi:MAG: InlB B-repeat-containing protein [Actinomycetia bacterium]|nr:InlB B-repeat-containing protein [Actinomycetes bacterium]